MGDTHEARIVFLRSGGSLTLTAANVRFLQLKGPERRLLETMIDLMDAYEARHQERQHLLAADIEEPAATT